MANGIQTIPDCQNTFPLDFNIYTFEHLKVRGILFFTQRLHYTIICLYYFLIFLSGNAESKESYPIRRT